MLSTQCLYNMEADKQLRCLLYLNTIMLGTLKYCKHTWKQFIAKFNYIILLLVGSCGVYVRLICRKLPQVDFFFTIICVLKAEAVMFCIHM